MTDHDIEPSTLSCKLSALLSLMMVDIGVSTALMFIGHPIGMFIGFTQCLVQIMLVLYFFFMIWKTSLCKFGESLKLCREFPILMFFYLYFIFFGIEFTMRLVSLFFRLTLCFRCSLLFQK
jgi:hypothetical protein